MSITHNEKMGRCARCHSAWCNSWATCQRCGHAEKEKANGFIVIPLLAALVFMAWFGAVGFVAGQKRMCNQASKLHGDVCEWR